MKEMILQFYEKYADYAYRVALVRTNNKADAEDLSQEVVLKIIKNHAILKELVEKDESQAKGYLAKAVVNMTVERYKKSNSRLKREKDFANNRMIAIDDNSNNGNVDENKHAILKAIKDLPEKYQTIIMLKFYEGHSNTELSNILNVKEVSIRSLISRAIQKLKQSLVATGIVLSAINITQTLEATELVSAPTDFKDKIIQNIHKNYNPVAKSSFSAFTIKNVLLITLTGLVATAVYTNTKNSPFNNNMIGSKQTEKDLFFLEFDAKKTTSEKELVNLVQKNGFKLTQAEISFEHKGIATLDTVKTKDNDLGLSQPETFKSQVQLPYKLKKNKNLEIYFEALNYTNSKSSKVGTNTELYITTIEAKRIYTDKNYHGKFTIVNNILYLESSVFAGVFGFRIRENSYNKDILISLVNASLQKVVVKELNQKEAEIFLEKNAVAVQKVKNTPIPAN